MRSVQATAVESRVYPSGIEAKRALRPVADADRAELRRMRTHPLFGYGEHASHGLGGEQTKWPSTLVGEQFRNPLGDFLHRRLETPTSSAVGGLIR